MDYITLFRDQVVDFFQSILRKDGDIYIRMNCLSENKKNRYLLSFSPSMWLCGNKQSGVGYSILYSHSNSLKSIVRFYVYVEKPLQGGVAIRFKEHVSNLALSLNLHKTKLYPYAGIRHGSKLLEHDPLPLDENLCRRLMQIYDSHDSFRMLVRETIQRGAK